jgi:hypothetical protein
MAQRATPKPIRESCPFCQARLVDETTLCPNCKREFQFSEIGIIRRLVGKNPALAADSPQARIDLQAAIAAEHLRISTELKRLQEEEEQRAQEAEIARQLQIQEQEAQEAARKVEREEYLSALSPIRRFILVRKVLSTCILLAVIVSAAGLGSQIQENRQQAAEQRELEVQAAAKAEKKRLDSQSLLEAFAGTDLESSFTNCATIQTLIDESPSSETNSLFQKSKKIKDARKASTFVIENLISATRFEQSYVGNLEILLEKDLLKFYSGKDRYDTAPGAQRSEWKDQWIDAVLEHCKLSDVSSSTKENLLQIDREFSRIQTLANSAPWFPEGYTEIQDGIAIRWVDGGPDPCDGYCEYATLELITKSGCSGLSIEATFSNDVASDTAFDFLEQLEPAEKVTVQFQSFNDDIMELGYDIEVTELQCY